jgi:hypothetical protein
MSRTRASAKQAGATFERTVANYLAEQLDDDRIDRRVKTGAQDKGDIAGLRTIRGGRVVVECKNYGGQFNVSTWLKEAEIERANDNAAFGVVVAKRRGTAKPEEQVVFMDLATFARLVDGGLDDERVVQLAPEVAVAS